MKPVPIIKDTCLLCGDGMTDDCNLCWKTGTRVTLRPAKRKRLDPPLWFAIIGAVIILGSCVASVLSAFQSVPAPTPATAISAQALYESQIRDLTHEIHAREVQLDTLVRALETTARERDAALNLLSQIRRGKGL